MVLIYKNGKLSEIEYTEDELKQQLEGKKSAIDPIALSEILKKQKNS